MDEIVYKLTVTVNDDIVFESEYPDTVSLEEELYKAERQVEKAIDYEEEDE